MPWFRAWPGARCPPGQRGGQQASAWSRTWRCGRGVLRQSGQASASGCAWVSWTWPSRSAESARACSRPGCGRWCTGQMNTACRTARSWSPRSRAVRRRTPRRCALRPETFSWTSFGGCSAWARCSAGQATWTRAGSPRSGTRRGPWQPALVRRGGACRWWTRSWCARSMSVQKRCGCGERLRCPRWCRSSALGQTGQATQAPTSTAMASRTSRNCCRGRRHPGG